MLIFYRNKRVSNENQQTDLNRKKDLYKDTPVRLLGFANEAGAAMAPLIGPVGEMITYAPALGYIALDVRDKYKRGDNDAYEKTSSRRATKQLVFQGLASVILPTAVVKTAQIIASKSVDKMPELKNKIKSFISKRQNIDKFINKFADKSNEQKSMLIKFSHGFQKIIDTVTVIPRFIKLKENKSGLRNIGLAVVGFTALAAAIKPIDKFVEKTVVDKAVHPLLYKTINQ